jgi:tripartite-type tricarboxylate transporter receptor subunit TctC
MTRSEAAGAALLMVFSVCALAQPYPTKPIRIVLPFAPGGSSDALARILAPRLGEALAQSLVIDNRGGAGGNLAADIVAKSAPDGYTLLMGSTMLTTNHALYAKLNYDPARDFAPITHLATGQYLLLAHPSLPAKNVPDLIALAKAKPGALSYASSGIGGASHLAGELLKRGAGIDMAHIPYKGGGPAALAVLSNETPLLFGTIASSLGHVKSGRLKALAVSSLKRSSFAPEVPTIDESGVRGFNVTTWDSFVAPAQTPKPVIVRIYNETAKVLRMPDVRELIRNIGYEPTGTTPEEFAEFLRSETVVWTKVIKDANIRAD